MNQHTLPKKRFGLKLRSSGIVLIAKNEHVLKRFTFI